MTTPHNIETPNWGPLEAAVAAAGLPPDTCEEFMWMGEWLAGVQQYKHCDSRRYVVIGPATTDAGAQIANARVCMIGRGR